MSAVVVIALMGLLDAVDDALFVPLGEELQVDRQDGQPPFFGFAQLDFLPAVTDDEDVLIREEDEAPLFMELIVVELAEGPELAADDEAFPGDVAHDVVLAVDAPQAESQDGPVVEVLDEVLFAHHEPEEIDGHQEEEDLHEDREPLGVLIGRLDGTAAEALFQVLVFHFLSFLLVFGAVLMTTLRPSLTTSREMSPTPSLK